MEDPRWLDADEMRAWMAFLTSRALLNRRLDQYLKADSGISHLQYDVLARLSWVPERELRMTELADGMVNSKSGTTYQVTQLEKAGLVRRRSSPEDGHAVYACLTDAGMRLMEKTAPGYVALVRELLIDVLTREQLSALADGLGEVSRRMLASSPDDPPTRSARAQALTLALSPHHGLRAAHLRTDQDWPGRLPAPGSQVEHHRATARQRWARGRAW
jgi:DNA-binding MarR family transcriptional regulator